MDIVLPPTTIPFSNIGTGQAFRRNGDHRVLMKVYTEHGFGYCIVECGVVNIKDLEGEHVQRIRGAFIVDKP